MGKALYRKYRSTKLSEIVGQPHITTTLDNALKSGKISHAYLFTGPRGVGKTSIARILAHAVNDLPYPSDQTALDIIEIDAASNRRIDEIRELRERVHNAPAAAKYKVYIIDEVHMLTREAFNALLKTLEEPPAHAIFILATTEAHKLPETIVSRTQRFSFKPIDTDEAVQHLASIAKSEGFEVAPDALRLIAEHGGGSFRDSISLLDQIASSGQKIGAEDVRAMLGIVSAEAMNDLLDAIAGGDTVQVADITAALRGQGIQAGMIAKQLGEKLRDEVVHNASSLAASTATNLMKQLVDVPAAHDPDSLLDILLLETALRATKTAEPKPTAQKSAKPVAKAAVKAAPAETGPAMPAAKTASGPKKAGKSLDNDAWQDILAAVKVRHNTIYSLLRMAEPRFSDNEITLKLAFPFHMKRLSEARNRQIIVDVVRDLTGSEVELVCVLAAKGKQPPKPALATETEPAKDLGSISNIFGDVEMLE